MWNIHKKQCEICKEQKGAEKNYRLIKIWIKLIDKKFNVNYFCG